MTRFVLPKQRAVWFDSHCHLHLFEDEIDAAVAEAGRAGVDQILTVGIDVESSEKERAIARAHGLWAAVGVHPNSALEWGDDAAIAISAMLDDERVVAVGETGLDFYRDHAPQDRQRVAFRDHIALAKSRDKCLVIHTRESTEAALDELEGAGPPPRVIFHCWSGAEGELERAVAMGAYVSFAGNSTFKNAPKLRAAAALVPDDRLLVETDAPFLAPVPHRGRSNRPAYVTFTGTVLAEVRGRNAEDLAALTTANAQRAFDLTGA
jgi:TatD DNase family protein